jgi:hypothetical protein
MPKRSRDDDDELSSLMGKTSLQPLRRAPRRSARQKVDEMREEEQRSKRRRQSAREVKKEQEREMDQLAHTLANFSMRVKSKGKKSRGKKSKGRKTARKSTRTYARYGKQRASKRKLKKSRRTHRKVERSKRVARGCSPQSTKKYRSRKSPPYPANNCCGATKKGNDGKTYKSVKASNGICRWVKK